MSAQALAECDALAMKHLRIYVGAEELVTGKRRHCIWMPELDADADPHRKPSADQRKDSGGSPARTLCHRSWRLA